MAHAVKNSVIQITNDGRPNFAADPLNGQPLPTLEQARPRFCHINNVPGCLRETVQELAMPDYTIELARSWQSSIGVQRQIGATMAVEADYVYSQGRNEKDIIDNVNLTFDPATGANYPFLRHRPPRVSGVRPDLDAGAHRPVQLSRAADGVDEATEQPLAGVRHLHAVGNMG